MNDVVAIIIPARYASSRLPGKPLIDICGKPMIQHVYERAAGIKGVAHLVVATDDRRIQDVVLGFGGQCIMTSQSHQSGTDRITEVIKSIQADIYINLQGDKPLLLTEEVTMLIDGMQCDRDVQVGTLRYPIDSTEAENLNTVKLIINQLGDALYFSRALIPYSREGYAGQYWSHVGIYGYRRNVLANYSKLPDSDLEKTEMLEQLRLLEAGVPIRTFPISCGSPSVDTLSCLDRVLAIMRTSKDPLMSG